MFESYQEEEKIIKKIQNGEDLPGLTDMQQAEMNGLYTALKEIDNEYEDRDPDGEDVEDTWQKLKFEAGREALQDAYDRIVGEAHNLYIYFLESNGEDEEAEDAAD